MPEATPDAGADSAPEPQRGGVFTGFGIASAALGVVAVAAVVLGVLILNGHRHHDDELAYRTRVLQAAADWTGVLVNMNKDTIDADLTKLHDGTVGQLNADFEATVDPYRKLVQTLQSRTTGQVDSVAVEQIHHDVPGRPAPPDAAPELARVASRTDTVMVVATSVSENAGNTEPRIVRWNLRLDVSDVDGRLLVSRLEPVR
jgi:hypothetical protein